MTKQVQRLLSLIETPKSSYKKLSVKDIWLLDSAASCHMTGSLALLCDVCDLKPIPVEQSSGTMTMATKQGSIQLNPKLKLNHVLFVQGLNCSLIL